MSAADTTGDEEEDPFDVELGEIVEFERPLHPPGIVVSVRLDNDYAKRLFAIIEASGRKLSEVTTEALQTYIDADTLRAAHATKTAKSKRMTTRAT